MRFELYQLPKPIVGFLSHHGASVTLLTTWSQGLKAKTCFSKKLPTPQQYKIHMHKVIHCSTVILQNIGNSLNAHLQECSATVKRKRKLSMAWQRRHCRAVVMRKKCKRKSTVCYLLCKTEREIRKYLWTCLFLQKETQEGKSRNWDWVPIGDGGNRWGELGPSSEYSFS